MGKTPGEKVLEVGAELTADKFEMASGHPGGGANGVRSRARE